MLLRFSSMLLLSEVCTCLGLESSNKQDAYKLSNDYSFQPIDHINTKTTASSRSTFQPNDNSEEFTLGLEDRVNEARSFQNTLEKDLEKQETELADVIKQLKTEKELMALFDQLKCTHTADELAVKLQELENREGLEARVKTLQRILMNQRNTAWLMEGSPDSFQHFNFHQVHFAENKVFYSWLFHLISYRQKYEPEAFTDKEAVDLLQKNKDLPGLATDF
ncbi:hypothetical protein Plhal703r1_c17g0080961 [Plasmopara halstedii]